MNGRKLRLAPVIVSDAMRRLYDQVDRAARATLPVLVHGETGVGKEVVAGALHERSARSRGPFVAINCASIPVHLIESVLFGHEKGAFTGASERRSGVFEQADGGTVLFDEVGELSPALQGALLRVLETKRVTRIGSTKEVEVDVRIVAATHRDLAAMVSTGSFREDLMFRLDALTLNVPALRDRVEEIEPLAEHFLQQANARWGGSAAAITSDARAALRSYRWPGNVRQLKNVIERAAVLSTTEFIGIPDLPEPIATRPGPLAEGSGLLTAQGDGDESLENDASSGFKARLLAFERRLIREALVRAQGNHTKAAALLKMPRRTLTHRIHVLGLLDE